MLSHLSGVQTSDMFLHYPVVQTKCKQELQESDSDAVKAEDMLQTQSQQDQDNVI